MVGRMGGGWRGGSPAPFPCPVHSHPLWYLEVQLLLPLAPGPGGRRRWRRALARTLGVACPRDPVPLSAQEMLCAAALSSVLCAALICLVHRAVWFSVSLLSFPSPHSLASLVVLWPLCSSPPPLWVCVGGLPTARVDNCFVSD